MNKRVEILIGLVFVVLAIWLQITPINFFHTFLTRLNNLGYDIQLRTQLLAHKHKFDSTVVIIDIDDKSLKLVGRWPWPRSILGKLIENLSEKGAVVIATDIMFAEKELDITDKILREIHSRHYSSAQVENILKQIQPHLNEDNILAQHLKDKDIVLGMTFVHNDETSGMLPPPILKLTNLNQNLGIISLNGYIGNIPELQTVAKHGGFINALPDADGIIRRVPLILRYGDNIYPSLALAAVQLYLLADVKLITAQYDNALKLEAIQLGSHVIPLTEGGQILVPFVGKSFTFPYYSAADVLNNKITADKLTGKIALIGASATGLGDLRATAVEGIFPGVEVQATIAHSILTDHYFYRPAWTTGAEVVLTCVLGVILVFLFPFLGPRILIFIGLVIPLVLIISNNWIRIHYGFVIYIFVPILLTIVLAVFNIMYGYLFETRRRERLKEMFGQYVPEQHIDEMLKASSGYGLLGEDREMTVLFADIRNFTTISEPMDATDLKDMLNEFFTPMTAIIFKYKGTIDKYIGDLIMAFWGAPLKDADHAEHALASAVEMQRGLQNLGSLFREKGWPEIEIGIGINTGIMSVGDMGSEFRRNYTVIGDAVNLGSRVEGLTKFYGVKIITTEFTLKNQSRFLTRQVDRVRVKGKSHGVNIFEVIGYKEDASAELLAEVAESETALQYYFEQRWNDAKPLFQKLCKAHPGMKLYPLYLKRITNFMRKPPPENWDGTYSHVEK